MFKRILLIILLFLNALCIYAEQYHISIDVGIRLSTSTSETATCEIWVGYDDLSKELIGSTTGASSMDSYHYYSMDFVADKIVKQIWVEGVSIGGIWTPEPVTVMYPCHKFKITNFAGSYDQGSYVDIEINTIDLELDRYSPNIDSNFVLDKYSITIFPNVKLVDIIVDNFQWEYQIGDGSWNIFPGPHKYLRYITGEDIWTNYREEIVKEKKLVKVRLQHKCGVSTEKILTPVISAPSILSATPIKESCYQSGDGKIVIKFDRQLYAEEYLGIEIRNTFGAFKNVSLPQGEDSIVVTDIPPDNYTIHLMGTYPDNTYPTYTGHASHKAAITLVPRDPIVVASVTSTNVSCHNGSDGKIQLNATGGEEHYYVNYVFDTTGWLNFGTLQTIANLPHGTYTVGIRDKNGCYPKKADLSEQKYTVTINQPTAPVQFGLYTSEEPTGYKLTNGYITLGTTTGGNGGYTYAWTKDGIPFTPSPNGTNAQGLGKGVYKITVKDNKYTSALPATETNCRGCYDTISIYLNQPDSLEAKISIADSIACYNGYGELNTLISGGVTPYVTYTWEKFNGTIWQTQSSTLPTLSDAYAGVYRLTVTDAKGNTATSPEFTFHQPALLKITGFNKKEPLCYGSADGWAEPLATGGSIPYTYTWFESVPNPNVLRLTDLAAGLYTVKITDRNNCTVTESVTLHEPDSLYISSINVTLPSSHNASNGSIQVSAAGGTIPYTYAWDNGGTSNPLTGIPARDSAYKVTVTDANGCSKAAQARVIYPLGVQMSVQAPVSCYGGTGSLKVLATGGVGTSYQYQWCKIDNGTPVDLLVNNPVLTSVTAGTYSVKVTDNESNTVTAQYTLTQPDSLYIPSINVTLPSSHNASNGSIQVSAMGGTTPYTYAWDNGGTSNPLTGIPARDSAYKVTITDANGCSKAAQARVIYPLGVQMSVQAPVSCYGGTGSLKVLATGGVGTNYQYQWCKIDNGTPIDLLVNNPVLASVAAGTYSVKVTDNESNTVTAQYTLTQPDSLNITPQITLPSAYQASDGSLQLNVTGGTLPYSYWWAYDHSTGNTLSGIPASDIPYTVIVADANGCTKSVDVYLIYPIDIVINKTDSIYCYGNTTTLKAKVRGGVGTNYQYEWYRIENGNPVNLFVNDSVLAGIYAGEYRFIAKDVANNTATQTYNVYQPDSIHITTAVTLPSAHNASDGSIQLSVTGGIPAYSYWWTHDGSTGNPLTAIPARDTPYEVTVTDANGCWKKVRSRIIYPLGASILVADSIKCSGDTNASLRAQAFGGVGTNYQYSWYKLENSIPIAVGTNSNGLQLIGAGTYRLLVTDEENNTITENITVAEPSVLTLTVSKQDLLCKHDTDGWIEAHPAGGTLPYSYQWSNTEATKKIENLQEGLYSLALTDANSCPVDTAVAITAPNELLLQIHFTAPKAFNYSDASVWVTPSGGTAPYTYTWQGRTEITDTIANIPHGTYTVTVTDANGCSKQISTVIPNPPLLKALVTQSKPVTCNGTNDANLTALSTGGVGNHSYTWYQKQNNGTFLSFASGETIYNMHPGIYQVKVTDDNGIDAFSPEFTLVQPNVLQVSVNSNSIACNGDNDGWLQATVSGGTAPYSYQWTSGHTGDYISGLTDDKYFVFVTDSRGCVTKGLGEITVPGGLMVDTIVKHPTCQNSHAGSISVNVSGGVAPYSYLWNNGSTESSVQGLAPGNYSVKITGANGCFKALNITLQNPEPITINLGADRTLCAGQQVELDGSISDPAATYQWMLNQSAFASTAKVSVSKAGTYMVTATDTKGCTGQSSVTIFKNDKEIIANFAVAHKVARGVPAQLANTNYPSPERIEWIIPDDPSIVVISTNEQYADVIFMKNGIYTIGMRSIQGDCQQELYKTVEVVDKHELPVEVEKQEAFLKEFIVFPNPSNGQFTARIELGEKADIRLRLLDISGLLIEERKITGQSSYLESYNISGRQGVHILQLISSKAQTSVKLVVGQ